MEGFRLFIVVIWLASAAALTSEEKAEFAADVELVENGDMYSFFSSGYPPHAIDNSVNPSEASVQNFTYNITINPDNTGNTVWCTSLGPVGFATNGVAIYNALTGETTDANVYEVFDDCKGHSSPDGAYHYHQFPVCVGDITVEDQFIGIALDGNPIYGPKASDQVNLLTSADLDACHGRFFNSEYRYHMTTDFPYVIGCYKAEPAASSPGGGPGGQRPPPGGNGPPTGRKKRQIDQQVTCTNTDGSGELCDCTSGVLTRCDTLTGGDTCESTSTQNAAGASTVEDGNSGSRLTAGCMAAATAILMMTMII
ncbi:uncharacterized protein [Watersipora subatra]|uniref:uncharacterized protein n=1 Tax=Watersipora subatra TaxID=2589382 RepID=UPI00355BE3E5